MQFQKQYSGKHFLLPSCKSEFIVCLIYLSTSFITCICALTCLLTLTSLAAESTDVPRSPDHWPRWRGTDGAGQGGSAKFPHTWTDKDWAWSVDLPGVGHASPVVWNDSIVVASADPLTGTRIVTCHSTLDGSVKWRSEMPGNVERVHAQNSLASSSAAVDQSGIYWTWATRDGLNVEAFSHDGKRLWHADLGPYESEHGFGSSLALFRDLLIVPIEQDGPSSVVALDTSTGDLRWKLPRSTARTAYSTPLIMESDKPVAILASMAHGITGIDPQRGTILWQRACFPKRTVSSPVLVGNSVACTCGEGGGDNLLIALRLPTDASLDGSPVEPAISFELDRSIAPYVPTPVCSGNRLYLWGDRGVVTCVHAISGEVVWRGRVGGTFSASPIVVGGTVLNVSADGDIVVIADDDEFRLLGTTSLGEPSRSTPAVARGKMFFRSVSKLYAIHALVEKTLTDR